METTTKEWNKIERKVPASTATGPDEIPMKFIKTLGKTSKLKLRHVINQIIMEGEVPNDWKVSKKKEYKKAEETKTTPSHIAR